MDIGKAFSYVFEDEKWVSKVLIGALFTLLGVIIVGYFFVMGYLVEIIRNVASGNPRPLPEWDNLGDKLRKGFMLFLVYLVYLLPIIVLYVCAIVPVAVLSGQNGDDGSASGVAGLVTAAAGCLVFLYGIFFFIIFPAVTIRYAVTESFSACFQFGQIFAYIKQNLGNYVIAILLAIVASFIANIGYLACFVGIFVTTFYSFLVMGHLFGQVQRQSIEEIGGIQTV